MSERRPSALRSLNSGAPGAPGASGGTIAIADLQRCRRSLSRREFCTMAAVGLASAGLAACDPGASRIVVGDGVEGPAGTAAQGPPVAGLDAGAADLAGVDQASADLAHAAGQDAASPADMAHNTSACSGPYNAGLASAIAVGAAKYFTDNTTFELFLCRDAGGLYALTASCPHKGVTLTKQATKFHCSAHGANFDLNGQSPTAPAFQPLEHYALCVDGSGNVLIDYNSVVPASTRA